MDRRVEGRGGGSADSAGVRADPPPRRQWPAEADEVKPPHSGGNPPNVTSS